MIERNAGSAITTTGTITKWKVYFGIAVATVAKLKIFRASGSDYLYVGQSAQVTITPGSVLTFDCNIAVQAGDMPGIWFQTTDATDGAYIAFDALAAGIHYQGADITADSAQSLWTSYDAKIKLEVIGAGAVKFFNGDPDSGGSQIGTTQQATASGGGSAIVSVDSSIGTAGNYDIYVHVDRDGFITETNEGNNKTYKTVYVGTESDVTAPGQITDLTPTCPADYTAYLTWTSPGDDDYSHTLKSPSKYKIQYSDYDGGWSTTSAQITIDASTTNPYTSKSYTKEDLNGATTFYFRIWTADEVPNWSLSSYSQYKYITGLKDQVSPAAVADLAAKTCANCGQPGLGCGEVDLSWTAPGDDGNAGTATKYYVKYDTDAITFNSYTDTSDTNFNAGTYSSTTVSETGAAAYVQLKSIPTSSTYNFVSGGGINKWGTYYDEQYPNDVSDGPIPTSVGSNANTGAITDYASISASDNTRYVVTANYGGSWEYQHFKFAISESVPRITSLTVSWEGRMATGAAGTTITTSNLYIWNFSTTAWVLIGSTTGDPDGTISATYTTNIANYVSGGYLYLIATAIQSGAFVGKLGTDFVKVTDNYTYYPASGTWTSGTSPVLSANTTAAWEIQWTSNTPAGTSISALTRTGHTSAPDATWSAWSAEISSSSRQGVLSPDARYIQYSAVLRTVDISTSPKLNDITLKHTTWWFYADDATGEPTPRVAGTTPESMTLSLYPKTTYYFAIRTEDNGYNLSGIDTNTWTSVTRSSAMACFLCPPTNPTILAVYMSSITMAWDSVIYPFENSYVAEASTASDFTGTLHSSATAIVVLSTLTVMSPALDTNTTYYLRAGALYGNTTSYATPTLSTSTLANPVTNAQIYEVFASSVIINWAEHPQTPLSSTCEGYILQASKNEDFIPIWESSSTTNVLLSTLTLRTLYYETTYYFRVGALNWNNVANYVSAGSTFTQSSTGDGTGTAAFTVTAEEINDASVVEELTVYGNGQSTITAVSVEIPYTWAWTGDVVNDVALSGEGFTDLNPLPDKAVTGAGTAVDPYVITIGIPAAPAYITETSTGVITISNLTAPGTAGKAASNIFTVCTKGTSLLVEIPNSPGIIVYGKLALETDVTWNPSGAVVTEGSKEYLVAAFTLDADGEDVTINDFTVKFTALGGATLGSELISFRIYKESNNTADGWDATDLWLTGGGIAISGSFVKYTPTQDNTLTLGDGNRTYYLTVYFSAEPPLELNEGVKVEIAASTIIVTGAVSGSAFSNTGNFSGNNIYMGGTAVSSEEGNVLRLGLDRHTFYDGGNYWIFYLVKNGDMADVWFKTSPAGGDWSGDAVKLNVAVSTFSSLGIWEDGGYVYASYSDGQDTYLRTVQISDKAPGTEYAITSGADNHSQIIIDSAGILWRKGEER